MAIDFGKDLAEQLAEETGPALERPDHFDDPEIEDDGFEAFEDFDLYIAAINEPQDDDGEVGE